MARLYAFTEHNFTVKGEGLDLLAMAEMLEAAGAEGTLGDLAFKIRYTLDEAFQAEVDESGGDNDEVSE